MKVSTTSSPRRVLLFLLLSLLVSVVVWSSLAGKSAEAKGVKVKGLKASMPPPQSPALVGQWNSTLIPFKTVPLHISLLPNGKILYWGRDKIFNSSTQTLEDVKDHCATYVVDPEFFLNDPLNHTTTINNNTTNLFCSGHSFLPDGRLLVTGGHDKDPFFPLTENLGEKSLNFFNYTNNTWVTSSTEMALGRWYPYNVTLANGDVAIMGGSYWTNSATPSATPIPAPNPMPERYTYVPQGQGNVVMYDHDTCPNLPLQQYPSAHLVPDGRILIPSPTARLFDPNDTAHNPPVGPYRSYPFFTNDGVGLSPGQSKFLNSSVQYRNGKIIVMGGTPAVGGIPVNEAYITDVANPQPWQALAPMAFKRKFHTATLLPDGKVLVSGGTQCPGTNEIVCPEYPTVNDGAAVIIPELWDPNAPATWRILAPSPSAAPRVYHSIALLLPDARVLIGGGGLPGAFGEVPDPTNPEGRGFGHKDAEIFSPPYLFDPATGAPAQRPTITWIQDDTIGLGQSMLVRTPDYANISSVVLVRLGSVTHGNNQDQRRVELTFTNNHLSYPQTLNVNMPTAGVVCPPGPYMMFLLNANGTPSIAKMVSIQLSAQPLDPPPPLVDGGILKSGPAVARNADGRLQAFYRGGDDSLWTIAQQSPGSVGWTTPVRLGGLIYADPVVIAGSSGLLEVLVVGGDGAVYYNRQVNPNELNFTGFFRLGGFAVSRVAMYPNADGRLQAFYQGLDNSVWTLVQSAVGSTSWTVPEVMVGSILEPPAVGRSNGKLAVVVRGTDSYVYYNEQLAPNVNSWKGFLKTQDLAIESALAVADVDAVNLGVFGRGSAGDLKFETLNFGGFQHRWVWKSLGGIMLQSPGVGANADNHLDVFVLGTDQKLYNSFNNYPSKIGWAPFALVGGGSGQLNTPPVAALNANGRLAVFARGADNALYMSAQNAPNSSTSYSGFVRLTPVP